MKSTKTVSVCFIIVGLLFAIVGTVKGIVSFSRRDSRIYTTATIVRIDERKTGDPEHPVEHTVYVDFEANEEKVVAQLNTYSSSFEIGKQVEIYYFAEDTQVIYEKGSEILYTVFAVGGLLFAALGFVLRRRKATDHTEQAL